MKPANEPEPSPQERLSRMRTMFAQDGGVLNEDYEHFTRADQGNEPPSHRMSTSPRVKLIVSRRGCVGGES